MEFWLAILLIIGLIGNVSVIRNKRILFSYGVVLLIVNVLIVLEGETVNRICAYIVSSIIVFVTESVCYYIKHSADKEDE